MLLCSPLLPDKYNPKGHQRRIKINSRAFAASQSCYLKKDTSLGFTQTYPAHVHGCDSVSGPFSCGWHQLGLEIFNLLPLMDPLIPDNTLRAGLRSQETLLIGILCFTTYSQGNMGSKVEPRPTVQSLGTGGVVPIFCDIKSLHLVY